MQVALFYISEKQYVDMRHAVILPTNGQASIHFRDAEI